MLGTTVLIPTSLVSQMGGGNVSFVVYEKRKFDFWWCYIVFFLLTNSLICVQLGRKSNADSKSFVCGWYKHINTNIVWDSSSSGYWRILYLCANYHFNHLGQSLRRWHYESSGGWFITNLVFFIVLSFLVYQQPLLAIWFVINVQKFKRIMRGTQGALIVASSLQIIVGFSGLWRHVVRFVLVSLCCYNNFTLTCQVNAIRIHSLCQVWF